jgi:hypothetical protein
MTARTGETLWMARILSYLNFSKPMNAPIANKEIIHNATRITRAMMRVWISEALKIL